MKSATETEAIALEVFRPEGEVFGEDLQLVHEFQNYAFEQTPSMHLSTDFRGVGAGAVGRVEFATGSSWIERRRTRIRIAAEVVNLELGAMADFAAGQEGQVRITVGAAAAVTLPTFDNTNSGATPVEQTATVATSSSGTGKVDVIVEIKHSLGSATGNYLVTLRINDEIILAANLPDPSDT
jgi:hypothetical protein